MLTSGKGTDRHLWGHTLNAQRCIQGNRVCTVRSVSCTLPKPTRSHPTVCRRAGKTLSATTHLIRHRSRCSPDFRSLVSTVSSTEILEDKISLEEPHWGISLRNVRNRALTNSRQRCWWFSPILLRTRSWNLFILYMPDPLFPGFLFLTSPVIEWKNCRTPTRLLPVGRKRQVVFCP